MSACSYCGAKITQNQEKTTIALFSKPVCSKNECTRKAQDEANKQTETLMTPRAKVLAFLARKGFEEQKGKPGFFILEGDTQIAIDLNHQVAFPGIPVIGVLQTNGDIVEEGHGIQRIDDIRQEIEGIIKSKSKTSQSRSIDQAKSASNIEGLHPSGKQDVQKEATLPKLGTPDTLTKEVKYDSRQTISKQEDKNMLSPDQPRDQKTEIKGWGQEVPHLNKEHEEKETKTKEKKGDNKIVETKIVKTCSVCGLELSGARALECFQKDKPFTCEECEDKHKEPEVITKPQDKPTPNARIPVQAYTPQGSIIKGFQPSLKEIGKIKIGGKGEERQKAGGGTYRLPVKYDHFEIVSLMRDDAGNLIPDPIMIHLGDSPKELDCMLLFNDPTLNFITRYNQYQGGKCLCQGDGEIARQVDGTKIECNPETCQTFISKKCKPNGILSVILTKSPRLGGVYKFRTTSFNSIRSILSSMFFLSNLTGGVLSMIPLKLTVSPMQVQPKDSAKVQTIYVVNIEFSGTAPELLQKTFEVQKYQSNMRENIIKLESTARAVLTAPESNEEIKEIEAEYYPQHKE